MFAIPPVEVQRRSGIPGPLADAGKTAKLLWAGGWQKSLTIFLWPPKGLHFPAVRFRWNFQRWKFSRKGLRKLAQIWNFQIKKNAFSHMFAVIYWNKGIPLIGFGPNLASRLFPGDIRRVAKLCVP
jgi:hypothetical protein